MFNNNDEIYSAYTTQLRHEHQRLYACLKRLEQYWQQRCLARGSRQQLREQVIAGLSELRAELAHHLAEEEAGGCVEEAVTHAPWLSHAATELEREDPQLLAQLDAFVERLQTASRWSKKTERQYRQLVDQICQHAAAESRIVEESFGMEVD
jgi:hypothetical protein